MDKHEFENINIYDLINDSNNLDDIDLIKDNKYSSKDLTKNGSLIKDDVARTKNINKKNNKKSFIPYLASSVAAILMITFISVKGIDETFAMVKQSFDEIQVLANNVFGTGESSDKFASNYTGKSVEIGKYRVKMSKVLVDSNTIYANMLVYLPYEEDTVYDLSQNNGIEIILNGGNMKEKDSGGAFYTNVVSKDKDGIVVSLNQEMYYDKKIDTNIKTIKASLDGLIVKKSSKKTQSAYLNEYIKNGDQKSYEKYFNSTVDTEGMEKINKKVDFDLKISDENLAKNTKSINKMIDFDVKNRKVYLEKFNINELGVQGILYEKMNGKNNEVKNDMFIIMTNDKGDKIKLQNVMGSGKLGEYKRICCVAKEADSKLSQKDFFNTKKIAINVYEENIENDSLNKSDENNRNNILLAKTLLKSIEEKNYPDYGDYYKVSTYDSRKIDDLIKNYNKIGREIVIDTKTMHYKVK